MRVQDPFGFAGAIQLPKDKKTVDKVHNLLFKKNNWERKNVRDARWGSGHWENELGDVIEIEQRQDRDGKNAFMFTGVETNRSALGTARGRRTILAKGRNEKLVLKKLKEYMGSKV